MRGDAQGTWEANQLIASVESKPQHSNPLVLWNLTHLNPKARTVNMRAKGMQPPLDATFAASAAAEAPSNGIGP